MSIRPLIDLRHGIRAAFADSQVLSLLGLNATIITCAAFFYRWVEGWGLVDAYYFSVVTLATVGYGDLAPQTVAGKVFTIGYLLVGLGVFVAAGAAMADSIITARQQRRTDEGDS